MMFCYNICPYVCAIPIVEGNELCPPPRPLLCRCCAALWPPAFILPGVLLYKTDHLYNYNDVYYSHTEKKHGSIAAG